MVIKMLSSEQADIPKPSVYSNSLTALYQL